MTESRRRRFSATLKSKVALAAKREEASTAEQAQSNGVHESQVSSWRRLSDEVVQDYFEASSVRRGGRRRIRCCWPRSASCSSCPMRVSWGCERQRQRDTAQFKGMLMADLLEGKLGVGALRRNMGCRRA